MDGRRYCSIACRQKLRRTLNIRTGLLRALNVRFATFAFTDHVVMLDVMPFDALQILSFLQPRTPGGTPADDFVRLANALGRAWWSEIRRSNKRYLAARRVLARAEKRTASGGGLRPLEVRMPAVKQSALICLDLRRSDLDSPEILNTIKRAYRRQAKQHHPDIGGDAGTFRRIRSAYENLLDWAENPSFVRRRGFPDRWFYDGRKNRWTQPAPRLQTEAG